MHIRFDHTKKLNRRGGADGWKPIQFDKDGNEVENTDEIAPSRFRVYGVKILGYTQTEVGFRTIGNISDEMCEYENMLSESKEKNDTYM